MKKISIVTINFNNQNGLAATIDSVLEQTYPNIEYIIIDGGSTDGSIETIKKSAERISYWISEKDNGIYHAQNKGSAKATGDYVLFLNSGDLLATPDIIASAIPFLKEDIVYGDLIMVEDSNEYTRRYDATPDFLFFIYDTLPHPATFINKRLLDAVPNGPYDENMKICSDWKFFIDAICKYNASTHYLNKVIAKYNLHGVSSLPENAHITSLERETVLRRDYSSYYLGIKEMYEELKEARIKLQSRAVRLYFKLKNKLK